MTGFDLSSVAAALRQEGYEARNLAQVGVTVWKDGRGLFIPADDLRRMNGNLAREVESLFRAPADSQ
jgi:hypothetical protein